jgi:hypothetical protein
VSTSPSETPRSRGSHPNVPSRVRPDSSSSLEIHQRTPLRRFNASRPLPVEPKPNFRHRVTKPGTCSAFALLPSFDGFLRLAPASLLHLASDLGVRRVSSPMLSHRAFPDGAYPSKLFPPWQRVSMSPPSLPSRRCLTTALGRVATTTAF